MKLAYITAGAGGMYCGACLNDNALASELIRLGHDVALIPIYTPIRTDETDVSIDRVFYGAINVFLEQKSALFRHTPWMVDRLLDNPKLLNWAAGKGASTDARDLGDITLSMLLGEDGNQSKELDKLLVWLREYKPDVVHLSNSMLLGMAGLLRRELDVPLFCSLQGEDIFIDELNEPYLSRVRQLIRERAADVDGFVAPSGYYVEHMTRYLGLEPGRVHQVDLGLSLDQFGPREAALPDEPFTVGYLARICPEKGLHLLVDAFRVLAGKRGSDRVRLRVAGYLGPRDEEYFEGIRSQVRDWGLDDCVEFCGEVDRTQKIVFLQSLHLLSVPTIYREPKGRFVLEALACGVPVVLPRHGAFPEMIENTGGGILVEPESPAALVDGLETLMDDPVRRAELGRIGRTVVDRRYDDETMARGILQIYERTLIERSKAN